MNQPIFRNGKGQIVGGINEWFNHEDESYFDFKVDKDDVIFPRHNQYESSEVKTWNLKDK
jgi:hypothetical protein